MTPIIRWLIPIGSLALGLYMLRLSYRAYAKWQAYLVEGDLSGAEAYEMEFWPEAAISLLLILLGAYCAGRWSAR